VDLTDQQKDLLRLVVLKHQSNGGTPFIFANSALAYPGDSISISNDELDFRQLRANGLITMIPLARNQLRGKPTDRGIAMVSRGFTARRVMREYENRCSLLTPRALEQLNERGEQHEIQLNCQIEVAGAHLRARRAAIRQIKSDTAKVVAEAELLTESAERRQKIMAAAELVVTEGVREFAGALFASQNKLVVHAVLLRDYTARLVTEIRGRLSQSELFRVEPLLPWSRDPLVPRASGTCEEIIDEYKKAEAGPSDDQPEGNQEVPKPWSPIVLEWEELKSIAKHEPTRQERIPESDLRRILADQCNGKLDDVTDAQIELAAVDLCAHYGPVLIVPQTLAELPPARVETWCGTPIHNPIFWKEREDEFRKYATQENSNLFARWNSGVDKWFFCTHINRDSTESQQVFRALAREAAKGVDSTRGAEAWIDWLDLLRLARDGESGKLLYAKVSPGDAVVGEIEYDRMVQSGSHPDSALIEFLLTRDGGIEKRRRWDTNSAAVDELFRSSANMCLEFRSLAPRFGLGAAERPMSPAASWNELQSEFQNSAQEHGGLYAELDDNYHDGRWALRGGSPRTDRLFRGIAARAATKLGLSSAAGDKEPWQLWVEFMLEEGWRHPDKGKWSPDANQSAGGWERQRRRAEEGARKFFHVFQVSADCCQDLAEREESGVTPTAPGEKSNATKEEASAPEEQIRATAPKKRGPKRDYETALQVAKVIGEAADDGNWRARLDEICDALDEAEVRRPKPWKDKDYLTWSDCCVGERALVIKAIEHHMELAQEHKKTFS